MAKALLSLAAWFASWLPMPLKRGLYRLGPFSRLLRGVLNRAAPQGLTAVDVAAGGLAGFRLCLDLHSEKDYWLVAMLRRAIPVYDKPSLDARVRMELPKKTRYGVETVCLVRKVEESGKRIWYNVWLPTGPNGARGWITERGVTLYPVYTQIVIDLSDRRLTVLEGSERELGSFPVAIGQPQFPTPTGQYFITEKVKPTDPTTAYGVLAIALSAYSPQLADEPEWAGGQVAIHGTNQPELIGQAISHGCIRMNNKDVLTVDKLVKTGSPVTIVR